MNIGLDWDDTVTRDEIGWACLVNFMRARGHKVYIVTWRDEGEAEDIKRSEFANIVDGIYATNRQAKEKFMYAQGIRIDVMIDDNPRSWTTDMEVLTNAN
jgi:hypothetical protein